MPPENETAGNPIKWWWKPAPIFFSAANGVFLHFNRREIHQLEQLLTDFVAIFLECSKVYNQRAIIGWVRLIQTNITSVQGDH